MSDTDWKKKCQELENEMVLIKGITVTNSPELREANKKIKELEEKFYNTESFLEKADIADEIHNIKMKIFICVGH